MLKKIIYLVLFVSLLSCNKTETPVKEEIKLKEYTSEEIYNKFQNSVVLIKHSFVYKINIDGKDFFFKNFDANTGDISDFITAHVTGGRLRGAGLGLSIVRTFVNLHGGTISAQQREPRGSRIVVNLPLDSALVGVAE